ncbi:MAG: FkbM family methyltransferase [Methanomicrobium sp.]|nr:FkbM family methyltransferase [Methanomicrobium sp.]
MKKEISNKITDFAKWSINKILSEHDKNYFYIDISKKFMPNIDIMTKHGNLSFFCPDELPIWRAETFFSKEPETLEWIDCMEKGSRLWDIGANVGCYSLYAGKAGIRTFSFEPSSANYYILNANISKNSLDKIISAYCIAFSSQSEVAYLNMDSLNLGGAINTFSEAKDEISFEGSDKKLKIGFSQGMISFSIDEFIHFYGLEVPEHIKIDVDGLEKQIIFGAVNTLKNQKLRTVLIELDDNSPDTTNEIIKIFEESGFKIKTKAHSEMIENSGQYGNIYNYIFSR